MIRDTIGEATSSSRVGVMPKTKTETYSALLLYQVSPEHLGTYQFLVAPCRLDGGTLFHTTVLLTQPGEGIGEDEDEGRDEGRGCGQVAQTVYENISL